LNLGRIWGETLTEPIKSIAFNPSTASILSKAPTGVFSFLLLEKLYQFCSDKAFVLFCFFF